jgi:predicted transposase/invertase (TIGR01784 family)
MNILSPKTDIVFKMLFGSKSSKNILSSFLKSVLDLDEAEYKDLTIENPVLELEYPDDKSNILDVKLQTKSGQTIDIEIQLLSLAGMRSRITYYLSHLITEQLIAGDNYTGLKRAICIVIVDFPLILESKNYHNVFQMIERNEHFPFNDLTEIDVLDLTKITQNDQSELVNWLKFLKAEKEEEFEMLRATNPAINEAYLHLKELSKDEKARLIAEARLKAKRDFVTSVTEAKKEGRAEGRAEGVILGQSQILKNMINNGADIKTVASMSGFSESDIAKFIQ